MVARRPTIWTKGVLMCGFAGSKLQKELVAGDRSDISRAVSAAARRQTVA